MQDVVIDKPYRFSPPYHGTLWAQLLKLYLPRYLRRTFGITSVQCRDVELLTASLESGHGILLAPNHCRPSDPMVLGMLARQAGACFFTMASWHVFMQSWLQTWLIRHGGAFSVYREGMDRAAVNAAIDILTHARRPLVVFPEGVLSRTNGRLNGLMDGVTLMARSAARKREKADTAGQVVVHPIAIRYLFDGDVDTALAHVLDEIETRLSWQIQSELPLIDRIYKLGQALLCLKEMEYFGQARTGPIDQRLGDLIDRLLTPLENKWLDGPGDGSAIARVKKLRGAILPDMIEGDLGDAERDARWRQLADLYLAQQLSNYPPDYIRSKPTVERIVETVERFEEDLTDRVGIYGPTEVVIQVGQPIAVVAGHNRKAATDPVLSAIEAQLNTMLTNLSDELCTPYSPS